MAKELTATHSVGSLLAASRHHRNIKMAESASDNIFSLDSDNTGCYILLANMYADVGRWEDVERVRNLMNSRGLKATGSCSTMVRFTSSRIMINHKMRATIYDALHILSRKIGEDLYMSKFKPTQSLKKRGDSPLFHSVRLATCFGLIKKTIGETVVVRKNVRLCEDCHSATKKISLITKREIAVGDGNCSCGDYW